MLQKIRNEIPRKYKDRYRQKLAEKCLTIGEEWAETPQKITRYVTSENKDKLSNSCKSYIKSRIDTKKEEKPYGSIIFTIVLYAVISWVTQKILEYLLDKFIEEKDND